MHAVKTEKVPKSHVQLLVQRNRFLAAPRDPLVCRMFMMTYHMNAVDAASPPMRVVELAWTVRCGMLNLLCRAPAAHTQAPGRPCVLLLPLSSPSWPRLLWRTLRRA